MTSSLTTESVDGSKKLPLFPNPNSSWSHDDPSHPGFVIQDLEDTEGPKAYYIHTEAKPGTEQMLKESCVTSIPALTKNL